jgi:hypothetical protein
VDIRTFAILYLQVDSVPSRTLVDFSVEVQNNGESSLITSLFAFESSESKRCCVKLLGYHREIEIVPDLGACHPKRTIKVHDPIYKQDGMPHCSKIIASGLVAVSMAPLNPSSWGGGGAMTHVTRVSQYVYQNF